MQTPSENRPAQVETEKKIEPSADLTDPELQKELEKAVEAFNASQFAEALNILKSLYEKHPNIVPPRIIMAQWYARSNLGNAVRASLEMGTEETPNDPEAFLLLAEISLRQGSLTAAELLLRQAATKVNAYTANPERKKNLSSSVHRVMTDIQEARQRWSQMETSINRQIEADGRTPELLRKKGIAVFQQKKDDEAKSIFVEADQMEKGAETKGLPADAAMSQLYLLRGDKDNARKSLETALASYPGSKEVLALSIQMKINDDKLEEAKPLAEKLLAEDPNSSSAKRLCATVALYLNDYATAEKLFEELLLASPLESQNANGLALALCEQDSPEKLRRALAYAVENVQKDQNNSEYLGTLGWVLYKADQLEQSANALKQSAASGQINAATAYYFAKLAVKTGKIEEAKQFLEAALQGESPFFKRRDAAQLLKTLTN
ncbi:MAG: tetratricopeptide repeat protein [Planctomycetaceae bacterium]|nr:tetratricopeptide repeat protein [Planctomycetaceae bacterium]